ncbi:MAG TPA: hypothetical protein VFU51_12935 [Gaiellaceae bacterium]|jgi:hypothetical protein|nr:hypothetical protein [Gaiellaceae bacterium]
MPSGLPRTAHTPAAREGAACLGVLIVLTLVTFLPHLVNGGFYSDDWSIGADAHFEKPTYFGAVRKTFHVTGGRPVLAALFPLPHVLFPQSPTAQIAIGVALAIVTCLCFFVLLRMLGLRTVSATIVASLALVFPWADSVRLWPTASITTVAVAFCFLGVIAALAAFGRSGRRSILLHAVSVILYAASILAYQTAGLAELLLVVVYVAHAPLRSALRRWGVDVVVIVAALGWSANATRHVRHVASPHQMLSDVPAFVHQGVVLFADALLAFPGADAHPVLEAAVLVIVVLGLAAALVRARRGERAERQWLLVAAASVVLLVVADVILLGSFLHPLDHGIDNRANLLATYAYAPLVYACVMVLASLIRHPRASAIGVACVCVIGVGWVLRVRSDERHWERSAALQKTTLAAIARELPVLPRHSSIVAVSFPGQTAPEVPVFDETWDLSGALELKRNDRSLEAFPVFSDGTLSCRPRALVAVAPGSFGRQEIPYGSLYFVSSDDHARIRSRGECRHALVEFPRGPRLPR